MSQCFGCSMGAHTALKWETANRLKMRSRLFGCLVVFFLNNTHTDRSNMSKATVHKHETTEQHISNRLFTTFLKCLHKRIVPPKAATKQKKVLKAHWGDAQSPQKKINKVCSWPKKWRVLSTMGPLENPLNTINTSNTLNAEGKKHERHKFYVVNWM